MKKFVFISTAVSAALLTGIAGAAVFFTHNSSGLDSYDFARSSVVVVSSFSEESDILTIGHSEAKLERLPKRILPGMRDSRVVEIKERLHSMGYLNDSKPDDLYTSGVSDAIALFQQTDNIEAHGIVDDKTYTELMSDYAPVYLLDKGMTGEEIENVQSKLAELNYLKPDNATGIFDDTTEQAVEEFQKNNSIEVTGIVTGVTRLAVFSPDAVMIAPEVISESPDPSASPKPSAAVKPKNAQSEKTDKADTGKANNKSDKKKTDSKDKNTKAEPEKSSAPSASPTKTPEPTPTKTPEPTPTKTPEPSPSKNPEPSPTKSAEPSPSKTPEASPEKETEKEEDPSASDRIEAFIEYAQTLLGKPYVLGGKGPDVFDCSGFIYYALNKSGAMSIKYMTSAGWKASSFKTISKSDLVRGDILCFDGPNGGGHVGIYLGNQKMLDASSTDGKIRICTKIWSTDYWNKYFRFGKRPW